MPHCPLDWRLVLVLVFVALGALGGLAVNFVDGPVAEVLRARQRLVWCLIACAVVSVMVLHLLEYSADKGSYPKSESGRNPTTTTPTVDATSNTTPSANTVNVHSLADWVSAVNTTCRPVEAKVDEVANKARNLGKSAPEEQLAYMEDARKMIAALIRDLYRIELPTDVDQSSTAQDWLNAYRGWYATLAKFLSELKDYADANPLEQVFHRVTMRLAEQDFKDALYDMRTKGVALGIQCPASDYLR